MPGETSARWKTSVENINIEIENYKQALIDRGIPEGKWMIDTLAKHRAAMLEQEGYNLDVASGNGQISTNSPTAYSYPTDYRAFYNRLSDEFRQYSLDYTNSNSIENAIKDISALRETLDLSSNDSGCIQLAGGYIEVRDEEPIGYEAHHIPSKAVLIEMGEDWKNWPSIALKKEDHKETDSYAGKQRHKHESFIPINEQKQTYKEECIELARRPGGFMQLIRDEILNIKDKCGNKYNGAIKDYLDILERHIKKNGIQGEKVIRK